MVNNESVTWCHHQKLAYGSLSWIASGIVHAALICYAVNDVVKVCILCSVVSNICYFHPYLGKIPILTNIFQRG